MTRILTSIAVALMLGAGALTAAMNPSIREARASGPRVPVLAELFTSEGCSSCPPADDLLRQLLKDQPVDGVEVIAISEHVDYWNRLGWRDPFSSPQFSERQSEYARAFGSGQIYTPQLVMDGSVEAIGNDAAAVREALLRAARAPRANLAASSTRLEGGQKASVNVIVNNVPATLATGTLEVVVAVVEDGLETEVTRGENARRRLRHDAVARVLGPIGTMPPRASAAEFDRVVDIAGAGLTGRLRVIAFLQDRKTRRVVGVATTGLN